MPSATKIVPFFVARFASLGLSWVFAVIAASIGLNALIKSNRDKSRFKRLAPPSTRLEIDTTDIFTSGICATTASLLIAVLTFIFFWLNLYPAIPFRVSLRVQAASLLFASLFLLGSMIPYMSLFLHGRASVKAFVGQIQLPDGIVKNVQNASGMDGVYKKFHYLKLEAVLPWFTLLFTLIAVAVLFAVATASKTAENNSHVESPVIEENKSSNHEP